MRTVTEDLTAARALIDTPERWTQGSFSTEKVDALGKKKMCYCALGAMVEVTVGRIDDMARFGAMKDVILRELPTNRGSVAGFNDSPYTIHQDVMDLFDRAIQATQETA